MSDDKKLGIGVIGGGKISETVHLPGYRENSKVDLKAICDVDEETAEEMANQFGAESWYTDYEELLARNDIQGVSVCTPNSFHREHSVAAAESGKHVLLEKPMAPTLEECDEIIDACEENGVKLVMGFDRRFFPEYKRVKRLIDEGVVGSISQIRFHGGHSGPYDTWGAKTDWFNKKDEVGGGALLDLGTHYIDLLRWYVGEISSVKAVGGNLAGKSEGEDNALVLLDFEEGPFGQVDASWTYSEWHEFGEIHGSKATLFLRESKDPLVVYANEEIPEGLKGPVRPTQPVSMTESMRPNRQKIDNFVEIIIKDKEPNLTGEDGKKSVEVVKAAYKSIETGERVDLPL
ncbi:MAG: Gfo/Idh/MocA family protein [Candidatus Hadarchaeia archaeon]